MIAVLRRGVRCALRLYPARVRHEFGEEVEALVVQTWDEESPERSALGRCLLTARLVADVVRTAIAFRIDPFASWISSKGSTMRAFPYDLRLALRSLVKAPGFTLTAVGVLAAGLAICTAVFTVAEHVLLRPLPYPDPERLAMLWEAQRDQQEFHHVVAPGNVADWQAQARSFTAISAFNGSTLTIDHESGRERIPGVAVSTNYFDVLGVGPRIGRSFRPDDARQGAPPVIIVSDGFWRRRMGSDPAVIGRVIVSATRRFEVVGVMPPEFRGPDQHYFGRADFWRPASFDPETAGRGFRYLRVIARLRDGVSLGGARSELALIATRAGEQHPATNQQWTALAVSMRDEIVGGVRPVLLVLLAAVFVVQLTVCANVAGLLLTRGVAKSREYAVRAAIGANAGRLAQGVAAEALLLASGAALAGLLGAGWLCQALVAIAPDVPRIEGLALNRAALGFAAGLSIVTALLATLVPAVGAIRTNPAQALHDAGRSSTSASRRRLRWTLVVGELAASVALLIGAGLLVHSFIRLIRTPVGFSGDQVTSARVGLLADNETSADPRRHAAAMGEALRVLPGVEAAGVSTSLPLYGLNNISLRLDVETPVARKQVVAFYRAVTPDYMRAVRLEVSSGRLLADTDQATAPGAMVVNEELARRLGVDDPLGVRVRFEFSDITFAGTIVGVVKGVRHHSPTDAPEPEFYVPFAQHPAMRVLMVAARAATPLRAEDVAAAIRSVHPKLTIDDVEPMTDLFARAVAPQQFNALLLLLLAAITLVLATVGLYAVVAHTVTQRRREIGIRLALGARREQVLRLVLGEGMAMTALGIAIGILLAFVFAATLSQLLYAVRPHDPLVFTAVPALLFVVALVAVWIPARRASGLDPVIALRAE